MPAVARLDPKTLFTAEQWRTLTARSHWRGLACLAGAWGAIGAAGALFILVPNPATYILAVMIIGARQLGLAILMHDAAHGALHPNAATNDALGEWLAGAATGASLRRYRPYHLAHHRFTEQPEDPDLGLSKPFPISRKSFWRKALRDLTGQTFFKQRIAPTIARLQGRRAPPPRVQDRPGLRFWLMNGAAIAALSANGLWWAWPALWLVPMATWLPFISRLRNIAEHAVVGSTDDPFTHARTTLANQWERWLIAPYWVHFHAEHHMFMHVPCWNLERLHNLLIAKGYGPRLRIARGYGAVLAQAAPV